VVGSWSSGNHTTPERGDRARVTRRTAVLVGVVGLLLVSACGGDDGEEESDGGSSGPAEAAGERTRTEDEPPASDTEDVRPFIENLLDEHDHVVNQILPDPGVARDREDVLVQGYIDLFAPDSEVPDQILDSWAAMGEAGERFEPYESGRPINVTRLDGEVVAMTGDDATGEDEAQFPVCSEIGYRRLDGAGQVLEDRPPEEHPGVGFAQRVDGEWRLWRIDVNIETSGCASTGGS
jgi:hypothetical protein